MSDRGRGSDSFEDQPEQQDSGEARDAERDILPPASRRPIEPYDPYRTRATSASRPVGRVPDPEEQPVRRPSRTAGDAPFLPDDDPLNSDAWQLELDESAAGGEELPPEFQPPARPPRRKPVSARGDRETSAPAARPGRRTRPRAAAGRGKTLGGVSIGVPRAVAGSPLVADQAALVLLGVSAASLLLMVLVLAVRLGAIETPTVLHLDAAGNPDRWGSPGVLWRLPLMGCMTTLVFLSFAWFLHPLHRFGARFALAIPPMSQMIAWVALIQHVA